MKKIIILGLTLVLALAVVGAGYAGWSQNLYINGTVETGYLSAKIVEGQGSSADIVCTVDVTLETDDTLTVTLLNAIPGTYTNSFTIVNTGSIPLTLDAPPAITGLPTGITGSIAYSPLGLGVGESTTSGLVTIVVSDDPGTEDVDGSFAVSFTANQ